MERRGWGRAARRIARTAPGVVGEEVVARVAGGRGATIDETDPREDAEEHESWVDAFVTLLAIIVFGLGWALLELEGADRVANRYAPSLSEMRIAVVDTDLGADPGWVEEVSWTARAPQSSSR